LRLLIIAGRIIDAIVCNQYSRPQMTLRSFAFVAALAPLAACFSPQYDNGKLHCATGSGVQACPDGYHCAVDHKCWRIGQEPPPVHSGHVVFGAGGGIGATANATDHRSTTSFGQQAGTGKAMPGTHSVQLGVLAGTASK
jgi:hypothetical protein